MDTLLIVGDGPVAEALAPLARLLGRHALAHAGLEETLSALAELSPTDAVVVLSHHDGVDGPALRAALGTDVGYIGAMGSRRTQSRRREWLVANGVPEAEQGRIHGPAGLDIGADDPAEIALSVLAELVAVRKGRDAATLGAISERAGPIHPELAPGEATCPSG